MEPVLITEKTNDVITYFEVDMCKTGFKKKKNVVMVYIYLAHWC